MTQQCNSNLYFVSSNVGPRQLYTYYRETNFRLPKEVYRNTEKGSYKPKNPLSKELAPRYSKFLVNGYINREIW